MVHVEMALAEPEPGIGELVMRVVIYVAERLRVEVRKGLERGNAAFAGQEGDVGESEGEFLFDLEEGHGGWVGGMVVVMGWLDESMICAGASNL